MIVEVKLGAHHEDGDDGEGGPHPALELAGGGGQCVQLWNMQQLRVLNVHARPAIRHGDATAAAAAASGPNDKQYVIRDGGDMANKYNSLVVRCVCSASSSRAGGHERRVPGRRLQLVVAALVVRVLVVALDAVACDALDGLETMHRRHHQLDVRLRMAIARMTQKDTLVESLIARVGILPRSRKRTEAAHSKGGCGAMSKASAAAPTDGGWHAMPSTEAARLAPFVDPKMHLPPPTPTTNALGRPPHLKQINKRVLLNEILSLIY